jgi:hypothetical protein
MPPKGQEEKKIQKMKWLTVFHGIELSYNIPFYVARITL